MSAQLAAVASHTGSGGGGGDGGGDADANAEALSEEEAVLSAGGPKPEPPASAGVAGVGARDDGGEPGERGEGGGVGGGGDIVRAQGGGGIAQEGSTGIGGGSGSDSGIGDGRGGSHSSGHGDSSIGSIIRGDGGGGGGGYSGCEDLLPSLFEGVVWEPSLGLWAAQAAFPGAAIVGAAAETRPEDKWPIGRPPKVRPKVRLEPRPTVQVVRLGYFKDEMDAARRCGAIACFYRDTKYVVESSTAIV